jgi:hypothetical protein
MASVRARIVFSDEKVTVTAIESVELRAGQSHRRRFVTGSLKPIAVIVKEPGRTYALDMAAQPVDVDQSDQT